MQIFVKFPIRRLDEEGALVKSWIQEQPGIRFRSYVISIMDRHKVGTILLCQEPREGPFSTDTPTRKKLTMPLIKIQFVVKIAHVLP